MNDFELLPPIKTGNTELINQLFSYYTQKGEVFPYQDSMEYACFNHDITVAQSIIALPGSQTYLDFNYENFKDIIVEADNILLAQFFTKTYPDFDLWEHGGKYIQVAMEYHAQNIISFMLEKEN